MLFQIQVQEKNAGAVGRGADGLDKEEERVCLWTENHTSECAEKTQGERAGGAKDEIRPREFLFLG